MRNAAHYGRMALVKKRMDGYGQGSVRSFQGRIQVKPSDYQMYVYRDAERFLQGFVGIFGLKRRHLPRTVDVETMPEGFSQFVLPNGDRHLIYKSDENYGIMKVRESFGDSHIKEFVELVNGENHV